MGVDVPLPDLVLVVPVRNEEQSVPALLAMTSGLAARVLFVDHASADATASLLAAGGAEVVACPAGGGLGRALKAGLLAAGVSGGYVAWMPGNLKTDARDVLRLAERLHASRRYGSAYVKARRTGRPAAERWPSMLAGLVLSAWGRGPYWEVGGTPTIVPSTVVPELLTGPDGLEFETFVVHAMRSAGLEMLRLPARFGRRLHGSSHWNRGVRSQFALLVRLMRELSRLRRAGKVSEPSRLGA